MDLLSSIGSCSVLYRTLINIIVHTNNCVIYHLFGVLFVEIIAVFTRLISARKEHIMTVASKEQTEVNEAQATEKPAYVPAKDDKRYRAIQYVNAHIKGNRVYRIVGKMKLRAGAGKMSLVPVKKAFDADKIIAFEEDMPSGNRIVKYMDSTGNKS